MVYIIIIILIVLFISFFPFRMFVLNPINSIKFFAIDGFFYFKHNLKDIPTNPFINVYVGLFGQGKTLTAVHDVVTFYNRYNDRVVWDDRVNKMVVQKIFILSNVDLKSVPYRHFHSLQQLENISKWRHKTDKKHNQRTVTICLLDECSTQLNSRSFKTFPTPFIRTLLTSRHALIHGFYFTSQRFSHIDALLRQVSSNVIECRKDWRYCRKIYYDAWEYENSPRKDNLIPKKKESWFCLPTDFAEYDTLSVVQELNKIIESKDFVSDQEIKESTSSSSVYVIQQNGKGKQKRLRK